MNKSEPLLKRTSTCNHCGGIMADYRGMVTCLMCGRMKSHQCGQCASLMRKEKMYVTA